MKNSVWMPVFVGVGSNLGDRVRNLEQGRILLAKVRGIRLLRTSPVYETDPVGGSAGQPKYLNAAWELQTERCAHELLNELLDVEKQLGRVRRLVNEPRTLDLDILFYGAEVIRQPALTVPHPRLHERLFVLRPLADLAPDLVHPEFKKTVKQMLDECLEKF